MYVFFLRFDIDFGNGCISWQKRAVDKLPLFAGFDIFVREAQVFEVAICQVAHPRIVLFAQLVKGADGLKDIGRRRRFLVRMKIFGECIQAKCFAHFFVVGKCADECLCKGANCFLQRRDFFGCALQVLVGIFEVFFRVFALLEVCGKHVVVAQDFTRHAMFRIGTEIRF